MCTTALQHQHDQASQLGNERKRTQNQYKDTSSINYERIVRIRNADLN